MDTDLMSLLFSKRFLVAFLLFFSFMNFQILRNNISITVVEMTSNKTIVKGNETIIEPADFDWNSMTVGFALSITACGGLLAFFGGFFVDWFGGAVSCAVFSFIGGIMTTLQPVTLKLGFNLFLVCRFIAGAFESFFYASSSGVILHWFPRNERSFLAAFSFNGVNVGVAVAYPLCGYLAYKWGWQIVFYVTGALAVITSLIFGIIVRNRPSEDSWISKKELTYILERTDDNLDTKVNHPFKSIFTSMAVWALNICMFSYIWVSTVTGTCLPLYIKDVTNKNTDEIGMLSAIPNIVFIFSVLFADLFMNYWNDHSGSSFTLTKIYKIMMTSACLSTTVSFAILVLIPNFIVTMIVFVAIQIETSFMITIIQNVVVNLCPDSANILFGLVVFIFSLGTLISQSATSSMVQNHSIHEWHTCFLVTSVVLLISALIFGIYGSNDIQPWSAPPSQAAKARRGSLKIL
ncbi:vesicular glutamate transporter 1-like [Planococcus citri]|uniref:vesicular glutamate transporter 1-like n=1 Tax=Planococcus citri TaxID=170843 RepID=UPI0031F9D23D